MAGRQSKWDELEMNDKLMLVEGWCRNGATDKDIYEKLGVSSSLFYEWKNDKVELVEALKRGKEIVDLEVENALFKRAIGYKFTEVTKELVIAKDKHDEPIKDENGAVIKELKITKEVEKEIAPDTTAQIFWLKNRKPKEWRDKQELSVTTSNVDLDDLTDEELEKQIENMKGKLNNKEI